MASTNFNFKMVQDFAGYNSSRDKTNLNEKFLIRGSLNMVKKRSGTMANRPGLKVRGSKDATSAGVKSSYEYYTSWGATRPLRVANNKLQVESDLATAGTYLWYDLVETSSLLNPARSLTRFSFTPWWEALELKDRLAMVRGDNNLLHWNGGMTKIGSSTAAIAGIISKYSTIVVTAGGSGYATGDILQINTGDHLATVRVTALAGAVTAVTLVNPGTGYSTGAGQATTATTGGGSGATLEITGVITGGTLTKSDTTTSWLQDGFATYFQSEKKIVVNGVEYSYDSGETTGTLTGVSPDPVAIAANSIAISSVIVQASLDPTDPITSFTADFLAVIENQLAIASFTSRIIYVSADVSVGSTLGMTNLTDATSTIVTGDPVPITIDSPPTAMIPRDGKLYVSAGSGDWYECALNTPLPVSVGSPAQFVYTKVVKQPGTGKSACYGHEFVAVHGNNIIYLGKDQQLHSIGVFSNIIGSRFPIISQEVYDELQTENFTGGHIRSIEDFIYITAPTTGRHWLYQIREGVDVNGNVTAERVWHSPQSAGISRIAEIGGTVYAHSASNPMILKVWDTDQWHDDSSDVTDTVGLPYLCIMRMAYRNHGLPQGLGKFDMEYFEGYMAEGSQLQGNVYFDYQGATKVMPIDLNSDASMTRFFAGSAAPSLGDSSFGSDPIGMGLQPESSSQELVPKFYSICNTKVQNCFEYCLEVYSDSVDARWELLRLGTNWLPASNQQVSFIRK